MDLARDARPLLRHGAPELGKANCPPDPDEQHGIGEQAQEVARRDKAARRHR
jgi:hypothetical protein